jgi:hypothetical protein
MGVLHTGLLGGVDIVLVRPVARPHLDDGVGAVARSLAMTRASPTMREITTEIGPGVSKIGMAMPS